MKKVFLGIVIGCCLPVGGALLFVTLGGMPVATKGPPLPFEQFIAKTALHAAFKNEKNKPSPIPADELNLLAGAKVYNVNCAVCHGTLDKSQSAIAKGLFPTPPQLFQTDGNVEDDPVGESYWKIKNGIRLTGMPGFIDNLTDLELWQVAQLLVNATKLPPSVQKVMRSAPN